MNRKKVVVGIIIDNNEVYLLRHNKCKGLLVFPSGKVEEGETSKEALVREMKEELNIDILEYKEFICNVPQWYDRVDGIMHTNEDIFVITKYNGEITNNEPNKHLELLKVNLDEIINNPKDYTYSTYLYSLVIKDEQIEGDTKMKKVEVKILLEEGVQEPFYASEQAAGMDIRANIKEPIVLKPLERRLIPTGIRLGIPDGYEVQVRPRSGLALKHGISLVNTPGTLDSDYTGEIGIILINLSNEEYTIQPQERIAQLVLNEVAQMELQKVISLDKTERGEGGFGHTGK